MIFSQNWCWGCTILQVLFTQAVLIYINIVQTRAEIVFIPPDSKLISTEASHDCRTVLSRNITECDSSITVENPDFANTIAELDITCAAMCRHALVRYIADIGTQCASGLSLATPEGWGLSYLAEMALYNFDVTCIRSDGTNSQYCSIELQNLLNKSELIEKDPKCTDCYIKIYQARLNGEWGYSESQENAYSRLLSSCSIPTTSYPITYTPLPTPCTTAAITTTSGTDVLMGTPAPWCETANATYTVSECDTCNSIAQVHSVANAWLESLNNLDPKCRGLFPGSKLCMPPPCRTHLVATNETCNSIIQAAGYPISLHRFLSWNVAINNDCTNIDNSVGKYICISPPGTTTIPKPNPNPTRPQSTLATVPSNAEPHSKKKCALWQVIRTGDTCAKLAINYGIRLKDFYFLNPSLTYDCINLMRDVAYCVKPVGSMYDYEGYNPFSSGVTMTETLDVDHTKTRYNYTNIYKFTPTTGWGYATNILRPPAPDPTITESYTLCPKWTDLPFDTEMWPEELGEFPPEVYGNDDWMEEYQRVCEPDWSKPLPTDPPDFPQLGFPKPVTTTTTGASGSGTKSTMSTTSIAPTVTPPGPVMEGIVDNCNGYHLQRPGDTCWSMAKDNRITLEQFYAWNPAVGPGCKTMWPDYAYCISTTATTSSSTTVTGRVTAAPPGPTQEGASKKCVTWYLVTGADTEGCWGITQKCGITLAEFIRINPWVGKSCIIWKDFAYCIEEL